MKTSFYRRLLAIVMFLVEQICDIPEVPECPDNTPRLVINKVRSRKDGRTVIGDIIEMKEEIGFDLDLFAKTDRPYEVGSAKWNVQGIDANGNDISEQVTLTVGEQELTARVKQISEADGGTEGTFTVTLNLDGDPDADEDAPIVGTLVIVADAANATVVELSAFPHTEPAPEPVPEPAPEG